MLLPCRRFGALSLFSLFSLLFSLFFPFHSGTQRDLEGLKRITPSHPLYLSFALEIAPFQKNAKKKKIDSKLGGAVTVHETIRVKSAAWDAGGSALLYSTLNHVKYALPDGDGGVVRTLDAPLYLQAAAGRVSLFLF